MDGSKITENIFESLDLTCVIDSIKNALNAGLRSQEMFKILGDTLGITKKITRASEIRLYHVDGNMEVITLEYDDKWDKPGENIQWEVDEAPIIPAKALRNMQELGSHQDLEGTSKELSRVFEEGGTIIIPANAVDGKPFTMLELCKVPEEEPFSKKDKKIVGAIVDWLDKNLRSVFPCKNAEQKEELLEERADLFLNVHRKFLRFCFRPVVDHESRDALLEDLMAEVNVLVGAERARIFLFEEQKETIAGEEKEEEVWPPLRCKCYESHAYPSRSKSWQKKSIVEFTRGSDVAWYAVNDKNVVNVFDREKDGRLSSNIEMMYGRRVNSVLSFPIDGRTRVRGAMNVINKMGHPNFTILDEDACVLMAQYLSFILNGVSLALFNSEKLLRFEVLQDMLSVLLIPSPGDIESLVHFDAFHVLPEGFSKFSWHPSDCEDLQEQLAYFMLKDLIDETLCPDKEKLAKFVLLTKNMYNPDCFHNFEHALNVLHCIYVMVNNNADKFRLFEVAALAVTALSHGAGRSGLRRSGAPLTSDSFEPAYDAIYGYGSVEERVMGIIKTSELFDHLSSEEYKLLMDLIMNCTSGTDLSVSYEKRLMLKRLFDYDDFDIEEPLHRSHFLVLMISAADLSGLAKPIDVAMMVARRAYEEFYEQGDLEKAKGLCPIEKMNRDFSDKIHERLLFFLTRMVKPVYEVISMVLNGTKPLLNSIEALIGADHSHFEALARYLGEMKVKIWIDQEGIKREIGSKS